MNDQRPKKNLVAAALPIGILIVATVAVYWNVTRFFFVSYDDNMYVFANPMTLGGFSWATVKWAFTSLEVCNWHPLTWLSHVMDVEFFGLQAGYHHATSLFFHLLNTILLYLFLWRTTGARWKAFIVAALFALHPMHVESVAWVSERKDVLSLFFILLSFNAYRLYTDRASTPYYIVALLFALCALMAKPIAVIIPILLMAFDHWPLRREAIVKHPVKGTFNLLPEKIPFILLSALGSVIAVIAQDKGGAVTDLHTFGPAERAMHAIVSYGNYALKMVYPQKLGFYYLHDASTDILPFVMTALVLLGVTAGAFVALKKRPYFFSGWTVYIVALLPVIGFVQVGAQSMADRYTYIPLIGIAIMTVWGIGAFVERRKSLRTVVAVLGSVVVALYGALAYQQVQIWEDNNTLYANTLRHDPHHPIINNNLGTHFLMEGNTEAAISHFRDAIAHAPKYALPLYNIGLCFQIHGENDSALAYYKESLQLDPAYADAVMNTGVASFRMGKYPQAEQYLLEALNMSPESPRIPYHLGALYREAGERLLAGRYLRLALEMDPTAAPAYLEYGLLMHDMGNDTKALEVLHRARTLGSEDTLLYRTLDEINAKNQPPSNQDTAKGSL